MHSKQNIMTQTNEVAVSLKAVKVIKAVKEAIKKSPTGVTFFSINGYENANGEIADHRFNIGASYENAKQKDIKFLEELDITKQEWKSSLVLIEQARQKLINNLTNPSKNASEGQQDAYTQITSGVKVHNDTGVLYIYGLRVSKTIHKEGVYPSSNKRALTIAQDELKKHLKTNNFRVFIISECDSIKGNGEEIVIG